jgi:hypothetical protein
MMNLTTSSKGDGLAKLAADLQKISNMDVLVGITEDHAARKEPGINNAQLLALHTKGSPLQKIPARPVIEPAIEASGNKEQIAEQLGIAAQLVLDQNVPGAHAQLQKTALLGQSVARGWFRDPRNNWPPNSPATVRAKMRKMTTKQVFEAVDEGTPITRPMIDTGALIENIIGLVREKKQ